MKQSLQDMLEANFKLHQAITTVIRQGNVRYSLVAIVGLVKTIFCILRLLYGTAMI